MENKEYIIKWLNTNTGLNTQSIYNFAKKVDELYKQDFNKQLILHDVVGRSEQLFCDCGKNKPVIKEPAYVHCTWCEKIYIETK